MPFNYRSDYHKLYFINNNAFFQIIGYDKNEDRIRELKKGIDITNEITKDNFKIDKIDSMNVPGPKFLSYHYCGAASQLK